MPAARPPWTAYLCLAAAMGLVGVYVALSKLLVVALPIFLLAWLRFGIAAVAMLSWLPRPAGEAPLTRRDRVLLFWESFLGNFLFSICMLFGVAATSALAAGVVMAAIPAAVALLSWLALKEPVVPRVRLAIVCAAAGIALLAASRQPEGAGAPGLAGGAPWWGYALLLGAVFCEASYVVIGKRLTASLSPRRISALINLWGLALVTPLGLWQARDFDFQAVQPATWGLLAFYAIAASMVTVWLWMKGLRHVPAAQAGVFTVMLPLAAAVVGVLWLGESFTAGHAAAFVLALAGLLLATWPARAQRAASSSS
jgi:drug/metabolite transporter (DMT)-like permease